MKEIWYRSKSKFDEDKVLANRFPSYKTHHYWCKNLDEYEGKKFYGWNVFDTKMDGYKTALERVPFFDEEDFIIDKTLRLKEER